MIEQVANQYILGSSYVATVVPYHSFCPYSTRLLDVSLVNLMAEINYWIIDIETYNRWSRLCTNVISFASLRWESLLVLHQYGTDFISNQSGDSKIRQKIGIRA